MLFLAFGERDKMSFTVLRARFPCEAHFFAPCAAASNRI
jgi:hypothetical protein